LGASASACLFVSIDDGLMNRAAPDGDASIDAPPTDANDDATDAGAPKDAAVADAATDTSPDAAQTFCAAHPGHSLCADFDDVPQVYAGWTRTDEVDGATVAFDNPGSAPSPPRVLRVQLTPTPNGPSAGLTRIFQRGSSQVLTVSADVFVKDVPSAQGAQVQIARVMLAPYSMGVEVKLGQQADVEENGHQFVHALAAQPPENRWFHLDLSVDTGSGADAGAIRVDIDGVTVASFPRAASIPDGAPSSPSCGANCSISIGLEPAKGDPDAGTLSISFDNVLIDW
jgi:hypothetical protein